MKYKSSNKRKKEIEDVYRHIGLQSEEVRNYFVALGRLAGLEESEKKIVFIEADITSFGAGEMTNARLESDT